MRPTLLTALALPVALATVGVREGAARACGGCFVRAAENTVVGAHRMAFAITPSQTVLWDQIQYSGDPSEFAWVLPVRPGARVELSRDAWFAALEASTQTVVLSRGPTLGGCALAGCGSAGAGSSSAGGGDVQVLSQNVVGPYETVTLRSTDATALATWLSSHAFDLPAAIQPTIAAYVAGGFDFIALRLRPQCGESAMQPVRVVTPGADPTLPLRMVAAGVGAQVSIVLYVLGEGRWRPQNFPEVLMSDMDLVYDARSTTSSNYELLAQSLMAEAGGTSWLNEGSGPPDLSGWYPGHPELSSTSPTGNSGLPGPTGGTPYNPGLASSYFALCRGGGFVPGTGSSIVPPQPCTAEAGAVPDGASAGDAAADALEGQDAETGSAADTGAGDTGSVADAGPESSSDEGGDGDLAEGGDAAQGSDARPRVDAGPVADGGVDAVADSGGSGEDAQASLPDPCAAFDDLDVAFPGVNPRYAWVTRLRANLPVAALASDLRLEAAPAQVAVSNVHTVPPAPPVQSRQGCASGARAPDAFGAGAILALTLLGMSGILRRRR